mgnify:CR=1 FL=1
MKDFLAIIFSCLLGTCPPSADADGVSASKSLSHIQTQAGLSDAEFFQRYSTTSLSGNYLSSQFAQRHHDWQRAVVFTKPLLESSPDNNQLINKTMVLAMGSGQSKAAIELAHKLLDGNDQNSALALLFVALDHFSKKEFKEAAEYIEKMPEGSLSEFILPLLESWSQAAVGVHDTKNLDKNTIHIHHAILIADLLGETTHIETLLQKSLNASGLALQDLERIADVYAYIGKREIALELYQKLFTEWPDNRPLGQKLESFKQGSTTKYLKTMSSPQEGMAEALYDMARLLFQEYSDDSARVFAHMALFLNPNLTDANLLLGYITARNDQYDEAIAYYQTVQPDNVKYPEARRMAADLLESTGRIDEALNELEALYKNRDDLEALIQMGDIYRRSEGFKKAISKYNQAAKSFDGKITQEYWQLYYVRRMSYERLGQWKKAEADLSAALEYQPENPLILNYLGYAWADQGVKLQESLELIRKAAALRPTDGYIIDSLGWVLYRMGKYEEAVPHLEKAVELLPYDPIINDHLGDVYWKVGRNLEARFQWTRAQNHSEDDELITTIADKLENGLDADERVKEAKSQNSDDKI